MTLTLEPGALVGGKYRLDRLIGRGGMGEVWAAEQSLTRKHVALKFLLGDAAKDSDTRRRFMREARAACAVSHPNVVQIHDVIEVENETPVLIMELLKGESLETKLQNEGVLGVDETIAVLLRVVSAVGTAHTQGVVHRDLKPDNIFLSQTPDGVEVKVLDFGIAKVGSTEDGSQTGALTGTGTMLGTPYYMSPEQAFGEKKIDHRADIWSLGIVFFRCLSGQLPTKADNLGQILKIIMTRSIPKLATVAPNVPAELCKLVDKMLSYSPADRPADLREVKEALEQMIGLGVADFGPPAIDASSLGGVALIPEAKSIQMERTLAPKRSSSGVFALVGAALVVCATAGFLIWKRTASVPAAASAAETSAAATAAPSTTAGPIATATATQTSTTSVLSPGASSATSTTASASASDTASVGPSARPILRPNVVTTPTTRPTTVTNTTPTAPTSPTIVTQPRF